MKKLLQSLLLLLLIAAFTTTFAASPLTVHFLDVGQADCILIQSPSGYNMLIDAGNNADAKTITSYLSRLGIKRFDVVVGTHPHEDHIGSLDTVINTYDIGRVYLPKASANTKTFEDVLLAIKNKGLKVSTARAGIEVPLDPALKLTMLAPNKDNYADLNDYSAVIKLTYNRVSFLFTGDAEELSESEMLLSSIISPKADVLKVGHHGSNSSTSPAFLDKVAPRYAVISVGKGNTYGHPSPTVLERLKSRKIEIFRTDQSGTIVMTSDGNSITVKSSSANSVQSTKTPAATSNPSIKQPTQKDKVSTTVYVTRTGSKYHRDGCRYLARSKIAIDLTNAKKSYGPCSICNPPR